MKNDIIHIVIIQNNDQQILKVKIIKKLFM